MTLLMRRRPRARALKHNYLIHYVFNFPKRFVFFVNHINWKKAEILEFRVRSVQRVQLNQYYFALYYLLLILFVLNTLTDYNAFFY